LRTGSIYFTEMTLREKKLGAAGEDIAVSFLQKSGYRIVERNYRIRFGEIDIIAEQGEDLVFIEVKTRTHNLYGSPFESVTRQKQKQLSKVALEYMNKCDCHERPARFDVVAIRLPGTDKTAARDAGIEIMRNAFDLCYDNK
jgi:putative endonuclease